MKALSPSRRRCIELRRRVDLLWAAWSDLHTEFSPPGGYPDTLTRAVDAALRRKRIPETLLVFFRGSSLGVAAWALTLDPNIEVCAEFAVELVFTRRAMTSMADVFCPIERVGYGEVYGERDAPVWGAWRGVGNVAISCLTPHDKAALRAMVRTTVDAVAGREAIVGRWLPSEEAAHLYGVDPLCPPAEALAVVAGWLAQDDPPATHLGATVARSTRPQVITLGLGPFAGPMMLGTMLTGMNVESCTVEPIHGMSDEIESHPSSSTSTGLSTDVRVDGFPFEGRRIPTGIHPIGIVVNLASENTLRLAVELVGHSSDLKAFKKALDAAMRQVDGFGDPCTLLRQRLTEHRERGVPVFVMGGPATHGVFVQLAHELGLVPEPLFGRDTSRCAVFVENHAGRAKRGIPHLPGVLLSLWRWS